MSYVQPPTEQPNEQRAMWPDTAPTPDTTPTQPIAPIDPAADEGVFPERYPTRRGRASRRTDRIVYLVLSVLETLLIIRLLLKMLAANPDAAFTSFIYSLTEPFVLPFTGVFPSPATRGAVLEVSTLLAIIIYALLAWLIVNVIAALANRRPARLT